MADYLQFVEENAAAHPDEEEETWCFFCKKCGGNVRVKKKYVKATPKFWGQYDYVATCTNCGDVQAGRYPNESEK